MKYIKAIGVELEGGWDFRPPAQIKRDASVRVHAPHVGEVSSEPFHDPLPLKEWMELNAPDYVDGTCGFHIHISTKKAHHYHWLTSPRFNKLVLARIRKWAVEEGIPRQHHFWKRWRGTFLNPANRRNFCRKEFIPELQIHNMEKGGDGSPRHCQLNFCLSMHGTLELRLFPGWEKENLARYHGSVEVFIKAVEDFIEKEQKRRNNQVRLRIEPLKAPKRRLWRQE